MSIKLEKRETCPELFQLPFLITCHIIQDIDNRDVFIPQTIGNTLYFHKDDLGVQMLPDQALLSSTPTSEKPATPDVISVEWFLVNAGTGFQ